MQLDSVRPDSSSVAIQSGEGASLSPLESNSAVLVAESENNTSFKALKTNTCS